ncbi:hypothetical protein D3C75_1172560 [compost metagenome]
MPCAYGRMLGRHVFETVLRFEDIGEVRSEQDRPGDSGLIHLADQPVCVVILVLQLHQPGQILSLTGTIPGGLLPGYVPRHANEKFARYAA